MLVLTLVRPGYGFNPFVPQRTGIEKGNEDLPGEKLQIFLKKTLQESPNISLQISLPLASAA